MTDPDVLQQRFAHRMSSDFQPIRDAPGIGGIMTADARTAHAAEYTAYHLGQLNKKMDRLIAAIEVLAAKQ